HEHEAVAEEPGLEILRAARRRMDHVETPAGGPGSVTAWAIRELIDDVRPDLVQGDEGEPLSDGVGGAGWRPRHEPRAEQRDHQEAHTTSSCATHVRPSTLPVS